MGMMGLAAYPLLSRLLDEAGFAAVAPRTLWAHGRRLRAVVYSLFAALCLLMTPLLLVFCPMGLFVEAAVDAALADGKRTADIYIEGSGCTKVGTTEMTDVVLAHL